MQLLLFRMRFIPTLSALVLCLILISAIPAMSQDIAVIVNKDLQVNEISADDIQKIFLGKKTSWSSGDRIIFAVCEEADIHKSFLRQYVKKSPSQFKNYWKSMVFTGKGSMPASFKTKAEAMAFVSKRSGSVSFVTAPADDSVKTIRVQ
jgi:ABC-type phosphate transport system substrate-binding protein